MTVKHLFYHIYQSYCELTLVDRNAPPSIWLRAGFDMRFAHSGCCGLLVVD